jgi:hypothetical protein
MAANVWVMRCNKWRCFDISNQTNPLGGGGVVNSGALVGLLLLPAARGMYGMPTDAPRLAR